MKTKKLINISLFIVLFSIMVFFVLLFLNQKYNEIIIENNIVDLDKINLLNNEIYNIKGEWEQIEYSWPNDTIFSDLKYKNYQIKIISKNRQEFDILFNNYKYIKNIAIDNVYYNNNFETLSNINKKVIHIEPIYSQMENGRHSTIIVIRVNKFNKVFNNGILISNNNLLKGVNDFFCVSNVLAIGISILPIIICIILLILNKKESYLTYLLAFAILNVIKNMIVINVIPRMFEIITNNYLAFNKIIELINASSIILVLCFFYKFYNDKFNDKIYKILLAILSSITLSIIFFNSNIVYTQIHLLIIFTIVTIYCITISIKAFLNEYNSVIIELMGLILYYITVLFKVLLNIGIIRYGSIDNYTFTLDNVYIVFLLTTIIHIIVKYGEKYNEATKYYLETIKLKNNLEHIVDLNTRGLKLTNEKLVNAYQQLADVKEIKHNTFYNVSCDLKTPISVVKGYIQAIKDGEVEESEIKEKYIEKIYDNVEYLSEIISDLYLLSEIEDNKLMLNKSFIEINVFLRLSMKNFEEKAKQKNISIEIKSDNHRVMMDVDRKSFYIAIEKIMIFIITNANEGSQIIIGTMNNGNNNITIYIKELGTIFEERQLIKLMNEYKDEDTYHNYNGKEIVGLGLYISNEIIKQHEGKMYVETNIMNQCTTFYIEF